MAQPRTIHDFYGFPRELYEMHYSAPDSLELVNRVKKSLGSVEVHDDLEWGLDFHALCKTRITGRIWIIEYMIYWEK